MVTKKLSAANTKAEAVKTRLQQSEKKSKLESKLTKNTAKDTDDDISEGEPPASQSQTNKLKKNERKKKGKHKKKPTCWTNEPENGQAPEMAMTDWMTKPMQNIQHPLQKMVQVAVEIICEGLGIDKLKEKVPLKMQPRVRKPQSTQYQQ